MPRKNKIDSESEQIQEEAPETGTARVIADSGVRIPGPILPPKALGSEKSEAPKKTATDRTAQNTVVPGVHLDHEQNRLARLRELGRTNRDVRWLYEQHTNRK